MISELYCIDKAADFHELMKSTFVACQHNMDSIAVPPSFISTVSEFAVKDIRISSTIDFPIGLSDTSVRIHSILNSARKGAKNVDIVLNNSLVSNKNWKEIEKDIKSCMVAAVSNGLSVRVVIEYRLFSLNTILAVCHLLKKCGVDAIITSTGTIADDAVDNFITTKEIMETVGIPVILSSPIISSDFYKECLDSNVFGVRFSSSNAAENVLGDVF